MKRTPKRSGRSIEIPGGRWLRALLTAASLSILLIYLWVGAIKLFPNPPGSLVVVVIILPAWIYWFSGLRWILFHSGGAAKAEADPVGQKIFKPFRRMKVDLTPANTIRRLDARLAVAGFIALIVALSLPYIVFWSELHSVALQAKAVYVLKWLIYFGGIVFTLNTILRFWHMGRIAVFRGPRGHE